MAHGAVERGGELQRSDLGAVVGRREHLVEFGLRLGVIALGLVSATDQQGALQLKVGRLGFGELGVLGAGVGRLAGGGEEVAERFDRLRDVEAFVVLRHEAADIGRGRGGVAAAGEGELRFGKRCVKVDVGEDFLAANVGDRDLGERVERFLRDPLGGRCGRH